MPLVIADLRKSGAEAWQPNPIGVSRRNGRVYACPFLCCFDVFSVSLLWCLFSMLLSSWCCSDVFFASLSWCLSSMLLSSWCCFDVFSASLSWCLFFTLLLSWSCSDAIFCFCNMTSCYLLLPCWGCLCIFNAFALYCFSQLVVRFAIVSVIS